MAAPFGHLIPAILFRQPMASGLPNKEKSVFVSWRARKESRQNGAAGVGSRLYHAPGTCTFYGTANTNQMVVVEFMGMQLPGSSVCASDAPLREALTAAAASSG